MNARPAFLRAGFPTRTRRWLVPGARTGCKRRCVSSADLMRSYNLQLASTPWCSRVGLLSLDPVAPLAQRHTPNWHWPVRRRCRRLNVNLTVVVDPLVLRLPIHRILNLSTLSFFCFGHCCDVSKLFQQRIPAERTLNRQRCIACFHTAVLSFQHLDLLVQQVLRQFVPANKRHLIIFFQFQLKILFKLVYFFFIFGMKFKEKFGNCKLKK